MVSHSELGFIEKLNCLKSLLFQFDNINDDKKNLLLSQLISEVPTKPHAVRQFHQLLMCMMAYPSTKTTLDYVQKITSQLLHVLSNHSSLQEKLIGTGLLHTSVECNFTYAKINYLIQQFPQQVSIHSASSAIETQKEILKLLLPTIEYSKIHAGERDFKTRISQFHSSEKQTDLEWLLQTLNQSPLNSRVKAFVYHQLGIFIQWKIASEKNSLSFLRGANFPIYFHTKPLDKKINLQDILIQKIPAPIKLSLKEKHQLIHSAKMTLLYLYRETEPFTNANEDDVTLFQLEKGISVALFGSKTDKRYSLESYIGYLVLKNNIPVSYGGGWIVGERSQFGINILEAFRGGESTLIICELLRVYHHHFGVTHFVVKPYQFGLNNPEAIKTGAFWFYYKLGFRPENNELKSLAFKEETAKQKDPFYKSDSTILKKYTKSNLALSLSATSYPTYDSERLSKKITSYINAKHKGNREAALEHCFKQLKDSLGVTLKTWAPADLHYAKEISVLFNMHPDSITWMKKHKKEIKLFIQLKSAKTELPWIIHLQKFKAFWQYIA